MESPEDAHYYDWLLIDPREFPFVSFRFHYRSWSNLRLLNLIPASVVTGESEARGMPLHSRDAPSPLSFRSRIENSKRSINSYEKEVDDENDELLVKRLFELLESPSSADYSWPSSQVWTSGGTSRCRPLPEIPEGASLVPRKSSESYAPSIAPSLLPYIEEESEEGEEPVFGLATQIPIRSNSVREAKSRPTDTRENKPKAQNEALPQASSCFCSLEAADASGHQFSAPPSTSVPSSSSIIRGTKNRELQSSDGYSAEVRRTHVPMTPPLESQIGVSESEWMKGAPLKNEQNTSAAHVEETQFGSAKEAFLGICRDSKGTFGVRYGKGEKMLRSLARRGVRLGVS